MLLVLALLALIPVTLFVKELLPLAKQKLVGQEAVAIVVDKTRNKEGRRLVYQFEVDGREYKGKTPVPLKRWQSATVGDSVFVQYLSKNPNASSLKGLDLKTLGAIWDLFLSVTVLLIFISLQRRIKKAIDQLRNLKSIHS